jgi:hypothetical protein
MSAASVSSATSVGCHVPWMARLWPCRTDSKDTSHMFLLSLMLDMTGIV